MTPLSDAGPAIAAVIGLLIWLLVAVGLYLWYAFALAKLFPKLGAESWKGWVPVLNDMEILVRGGVPGWSIVFAFIPFVSFYYLYLRIVAAHRIGVRFGRGAGTTVFAVVLPPLWATLLASAQPVTGEPLEQRVAGYAGMQAEPVAAPAAPPVVAAPPVPPVVTAPPVPPAPPVLPAPAVPPAPPVVAAAPAPPPPSAPPAPPVVATPPTLPTAPALPTAPVASAAPAPGPVAPPIGEPPALIEPQPPAPPAVPVVRPAPPAPAAPAAPAASTQPAPAPVVRPAPEVPITVPAEQARSAAPQPATVRPAPASPAADANPAATTPLPAESADDDEFGETIVVDRRPRIRAVLQVEGGPAIPLTADRVVLGRKPAGGAPGTQDLAVPDTTRTLSKVHARVERGEEGWIITDLESTNGVVVVASDGTETLLDRGASSPVTGRFILGKVAMSIVEEGASA